jgi:hypothetical protein
MVALDLSGDGHADLALLQNSHAPAPFLGRFTGGLGLVLVNDGQGGFLALGPQESGFIVPGDAKALVVTDRNGDGWPDLVASRNDQTALAFHGLPLAGRRPLRVVLRGAAGNPTGIGARVTLTLADGSTRSGEVAAGSGYYSQSSPALYFSYPAETPPRLLAVVWPDGSTAHHPVAPDATGTLSIRQESR